MRPRSVDRVDARCGEGTECARAVCLPGAAGSDTAGCQLQPRVEAVYCAEDANPCTMDACRAGACVHDHTDAPSDCASLAKVLAAAIDLRGRMDGLHATIAAASATGCVAVGANTGCDIVGGSGGPGARLVDLVAQARGDLDETIAALGGRLGSAQSGILRARLALPLIQSTPDTLRNFRAVLAAGRAQKTVSPLFARARRAEGSALLRATAKLNAALRRASRQRRSFTR